MAIIARRVSATITFKYVFRLAIYVLIALPTIIILQFVICKNPTQATAFCQ